jgi:hypothetical protein
MNNVTLDPTLVALIAGTVLPLLVAFVTKAGASSGLKAGVTIVASALIGTLNGIVNNGGTFDWKVALTSTLITIVTGFTTYNGLWKPVAGVNQKFAPNFGLGAVTPAVEAPPAV